MQNILKNTSADDNSGSPWILLLILGGYVLAALFLFNYLGLMIVMFMYGYDMSDTLSILTNPYGTNDNKIPLLIIQGVTSLGAFVMVPIFYIRRNLHLRTRFFFRLPETPLRAVFMTAVILFCFMVANSVVIEWNQSINMPEAFSWFEQWAQGKEDQLEQLTKYLTSFTGFHEYFIALVVIAILPAVGEELLFRGLIQNLFGSVLKNPHVAIWASAVLFGVFHLQFYGVVPRIFLGALFGYLYYWSGHLSLAMVGHFVNNGLTLTLLYFTQLEIIDYDPTGASSSPPIYVTAIFFVAGGVLLYLFRNYFAHSNHA